MTSIADSAQLTNMCIYRFVVRASHGFTHLVTAKVMSLIASQHLPVQHAARPVMTIWVRKSLTTNDGLLFLVSQAWVASWRSGTTVGALLGPVVVMGSGVTGFGRRKNFRHSH